MAIRELRNTKAKLAARERAGFQPDELKLIGSITDRLVKSWPFRFAVLAFVGAVVFAVTGSIVVEDKTHNFLEDIDNHRTEVEARVKAFDMDAKDQVTAVMADVNDLRTRSAAIKGDIVNQVVAELSQKFDGRESALSAKLGDAERVQIDLSGKLNAQKNAIDTLTNDVTQWQAKLAKLPDPEAAVGRITTIEAQATSALEKINGSVTSAAAASGAAEGLRKSVDQSASRIQDQDRAAVGFASRATALDTTLTGLASKVDQLKTDAATALPILANVTKTGDMEQEAARHRDAAIGAEHAIEAAKGKAEADASSIQETRRRAETDAGQIEQRLLNPEKTPVVVPANDPVILAIDSRLGKLEQPAPTARIAADDPIVLDILARLKELENPPPKPVAFQPVDLPVLRGNDCRRVQQSLHDVAAPGLLVDGICGSGTNAAARDWQVRFSRRLDGSGGANAIVQQLTAPSPDTTKP